MSGIRRRTAIACGLAAGLATISWLSSCREDSPTPPEVEFAIIQGTAFDGLPILPDSLEVVARNVGPGNSDQVRGPVAPDGSYALTVPRGNYVLYLDAAPAVYYSLAGPTLQPAEADTIRANADVFPADLACGRARIEVSVPPAMRIGRWSVRLQVQNAAPWVVVGPSQDAAATVAAEFRLLPPSRYVVQLRSEFFGDVFLPPTLEFAEAAPLEVTTGNEARQLSALTGVATLEGRVSGSWQELELGRPDVRAYFTPDDMIATTTTATGSFALQSLAAATFRFEVNIGGVTRWIGGDDYASATAYPVAPGETITEIVHLESGLECRFSPLGEAPAYLYDVSLVEASGFTLPVVARDGQVRVANLAPGAIYLHLSTWSHRATWLPQYWDRKPALQYADAITIPTGGRVARVTATLERGGRIFGRLLDADDQVPDPENLFVLVHAADDSFHVQAFYSNQDFVSDLFDPATGDYTLTQLPDGQYRLRALAGGDRWTWWPGRAAWDSAGVVTIANHADVAGIDWHLLPGPSEGRPPAGGDLRIPVGSGQR